MSKNMSRWLIPFAALLMALPAHSARRDGLNGNLLIKDHDDVFLFPHRAHSDLNRNRMRIDLEETTRSTFFNSTGNGAWGFAIGNTTECP